MHALLLSGPSASKAGGCRGSPPFRPSTTSARLQAPAHAQWRQQSEAWARQRDAAHWVPRRRAAAGVGSGAPDAGLAASVLSFVDAFKRRDLDGMIALLADDIEHHNLACDSPHCGRQAVAQALEALLAASPPDWRLVVEDSCASGGGASASVALSWHMESAGGQTVPLSQGLSFYTVDARTGQIRRIKEASEQLVKLPSAALPALAAARPLVQALSSGPLAALAAAAAGSAAGSWSGAPSASGQAAAPGGGAKLRPVLFSMSGAAEAGGGPGASSSTGDVSSGSGRASSAPAGSASPVASPPLAGLGALASTWIKDHAASDMDSYYRSLDLLQLRGLEKTTAMRLIEGMELEQQGSAVRLRFLTVVPFFSVTETFQLGSTTAMGRRDLRPGQQRSRAALEAGPPGCAAPTLVIHTQWEEPNAGSLTERFALSEGNSLEVYSTVSVAAGSESTRRVFRRAAFWRPRYSWGPWADWMAARGR